MSIRNVIFGVGSVTVSYLIRYGILLQNAADVITKCDSYLFQNATEVYYKMRQVFYYKRRQFYYKKCGDFITKCDSYYKM